MGDRTVARSVKSDAERLHELGYAQELARTMSAFSNFAVSFTIISVLSGCLTLYGYGMNTGGPVLIVWGWPLVGVMTLVVGLACLSRAPDMAIWLMVIGGVVAAIGVLLIWVRSRLRADE